MLTFLGQLLPLGSRAQLGEVAARGQGVFRYRRKISDSSVARKMVGVFS